MTQAALHREDAEHELYRWQRSVAEYPFSDWLAETCATVDTELPRRWGAVFDDGSELDLVGDARDGQLEVV